MEENLDNKMQVLLNSFGLGHNDGGIQQQEVTGAVQEYQLFPAGEGGGSHHLLQNFRNIVREHGCFSGVGDGNATGSHPRQYEDQDPIRNRVTGSEFHGSEGHRGGSSRHMLDAMRQNFRNRTGEHSFSRIGHGDSGATGSHPRQYEDQDSIQNRVTGSEFHGDEGHRGGSSRHLLDAMRQNFRNRTGAHSFSRIGHGDSGATGSHPPQYEDQDSIRNGITGWSGFHCGEGGSSHQLQRRTSSSGVNNPNPQTQFKNDFVEKAITPEGSKRLQELISSQSQSVIKEIFNGIIGSIVHLMLNDQGCRVVASMIPLLEENQLAMIAEQLSRQWLELATDRIGCYSLNNFISHVEAPLRLELLNCLADNSVFLATHATGNHVLQNILQLQDQVGVQKICSNLRGQYRWLALEKKGNYVVQKCLDSSCWVYAMDDLLQLNEAHLVRLAKDQFGNFVVMKALQVSHSKAPEHYFQLVRRLNNNLSQLRYGYGNRVRLEMLNLGGSHNKNYYF